MAIKSIKRLHMPGQGVMGLPALSFNKEPHLSICHNKKLLLH